MENNDLDDVRLHATQAFEAVERSYNKIGRGKRFLIKAQRHNERIIPFARRRARKCRRVHVAVILRDNVFRHF